MLKAAGRHSGLHDRRHEGLVHGTRLSSAGTHAGGGAVDISVSRGGCGKPNAHGGRPADGRVRRLVPPYRHFADNKHIHAIAISDLDMSTEAAFPGVFDAREQIVAWAQGKDGLSGAVVAPMSNGPLQTWERYKRAT